MKNEKCPKCGREYPWEHKDGPEPLNEDSSELYLDSQCMRCGHWMREIVEVKRREYANSTHDFGEDQ